MAPSPPMTPDPSHPYSGGFEELDLDDEPLTPNPATTAKQQDRKSNSQGISPSTSFSYASPISQKDDPWRSSIAASSSAASNPNARFSSSTAGNASPPKMERASTSTSKASFSGSKYGANDAAVLGVAVVDFNHLIGPTVEYAYPASLQDALSNDEELNRLLPFLALPDGAHLSEEDYSYFHFTYDPTDPAVDTDLPPNTTLFGISCNRQLPASELLVRPSDVTRSTVQKAVVVIATQPVFGPIRDQLGVVTRAYFAQKDFTRTEIIEEFYASLESTLEGKTGEGAIYMGTNLRDLIHKFRHRTLMLVKLLMLQKRIMLFGYPVEMLCNHQYSLVSLIPGLLMQLRECGSPELDHRTTRTRPTSLRTSDRASLLRYMGLPLYLFGKDAFFQPYLPLQQVESLRAPTWLVGSTNQIVTQQRDCKFDVLVNIQDVTFEFSDPKLERIVGLTAADRKWMDDMVNTVEETWGRPEGERTNFRGSDDDLRARFEEYICAALSTVKYSDFIQKGKAADVSIVSAGPEGGNVLAPFGEHWLQAFKETKAYDVWDSMTDPVLFDLCEPRHPCDGKVTVVSDIGLRLAEGIHELKIDQSLAPTREVLNNAFAAGSSAFATGSSSLFRAFDGARNGIATKMKEREEAERIRREKLANDPNAVPSNSSPITPAPSTSTGTPVTGLGGQSTNSGPTSGPTSPPLADIRSTLGGIGSGIGSFFGSRVASIRGTGASPSGPPAVTPEKRGLRPMSLTPSATTSTSAGKDRSVSGSGQHP